MKRLYVNSDDFGLTEGVTLGILEGIERGCVTSTSAMVCAPDSTDLLTRYGGRLPGRIGLHMQLTDGQPCLPPSEIPSLVGPDGRFPRSWRQLGQVDPQEILLEWQAQYDRLLELGIRPTHLDTHHNIHRHPVVVKAYLVAARRWRLPVRSGHPIVARQITRQRVTCPDASVLEWFGGELSVDSVVRTLQDTFRELGGEGTVEMACHVAHVDAALRERSTYVEERERELAVLCAPELPGRLATAGIELVVPEVMAV